MFLKPITSRKSFHRWLNQTFRVIITLITKLLQYTSAFARDDLYFYFFFTFFYTSTSQSEYYAEILVGKPGQRFTVIFDTTWSDMWLPSKLCSKTLSPACSEWVASHGGYFVSASWQRFGLVCFVLDTKHLYDGNASSTHKPIDPKPFDIGGYVGNLTCDTVRVSITWRHENVISRAGKNTAAVQSWDTLVDCTTALEVDFSRVERHNLEANLTTISASQITQKFLRHSVIILISPTLQTKIHWLITLDLYSFSVLIFVCCKDNYSTFCLDSCVGFRPMKNVYEFLIVFLTEFFSPVLCCWMSIKWVKRFRSKIVGSGSFSCYFSLQTNLHQVCYGYFRYFHCFQTGLIAWFLLIFTSM